MRIKVTMSIVLLAAACATQALANYFYNPYANLSPNIGSAPSPTPRDTPKNRMPKAVRAAPPYANIVADDTPKHTDKPARNDQSSSQDGEEAKDRREL
jgi:hypothetical protein